MEQQAMATTIGTRIGKILFIIVAAIASVVLAGCTSGEEIIVGLPMQEAYAVNNQQDAKLSSEIGEIQASVIGSDSVSGNSSDSKDDNADVYDSDVEDTVKNIGSDTIITIGSSDSASDLTDVNSTSDGTSSPYVTDIIVGTDSKSEALQDTSINQQSDIITITTDIVSAIKEVVTDIITDTSAEILIDMFTETSSQKAEVTSEVPEKKDAEMDKQSTEDVQSAKDVQSTKDTQIAPADTQVSPADIVQLNDGTTWYTSKAYQYKVQFPSWVEAGQMKTTDLLLSGNSANKTGLTKQQMALVAHFTLRTEFEYYPEYMKYDAWWKNLYGKPDEVETYKGQTFKYHSADSDGGFNRYTYVKIGNIGALRIEMKFVMPEHLYVDGFEQKALEVLHMVTNSAKAAK